jgi:hypothetical protein
MYLDHKCASSKLWTISVLLFMIMSLYWVLPQQLFYILSEYFITVYIYSLWVLKDAFANFKFVFGGMFQGPARKNGSITVCSRTSDSADLRTPVRRDYRRGLLHPGAMRGAFLFLPDWGMAVSFSSSLHPESIASCSFLLRRYSAFHAVVLFAEMPSFYYMLHVKFAVRFKRTACQLHIAVDSFLLDLNKVYYIWHIAL